MSSKIFKIFCFCLCSFGILISSGNVLAAACGSATQQGWPTAPTINLCSNGTVLYGPMINEKNVNWQWFCTGGDPAFVFCTAPLLPDKGWIRKSSWIYPRMASTVASTGSKIYAIGGYRYPLESPYNTIEEYNPATNTWTAKSADTYSYNYGMAASVNGNIYFIGGESSVITGSNKQYSPGENSWTAKASMPTPRRSAAAAVSNNKIYVMGGYVPSGYGWTNVNEEYNPATNTWTTKAPMPTSRHSMGAAMVNGKIYVIGGILSTSNSATSINEEYNPDTNTWTTKAPMPTARAHTFPVAYNNKIYVIGGWNGSWVTVNEIYDPATNTWTTGPSIPQSVSDAVVAVAQNKIYVMGGYSEKITFEYDPTKAPINGLCGFASGHGYYTKDVIAPEERCSAGTFGGTFTDNGYSWSWTCNGINGGTNASCSANKVACGSYHNTIRRDQPSSNLCSYGTNTSLTLTSNVWYWSCTNNPGVDAACYAYKTTCGSSNGGIFSSAPTTNLCAYGTASSVTTGGTTFTWTCTGNDSLAVSCSANRIVNGTCGSANGQSFYTAPTSNLCASGVASIVSGSGPWNWTCTSWSPILDQNVRWTGVAISSATGQYQAAVSPSAGLAYLSNNYGQNWTQIAKSVLNNMCVAISSTGQYQTIGAFGISISNDYGRTWTSRSTSTYDFRSVDISDSGQYQIISGRDGILVSNDYGQTWVQKITVSATENGPSDVAVSSTGQYQMGIIGNSNGAVADGITIYTSNDYGQSWTSLRFKQLCGYSIGGFGAGMSGTGQYQATGCKNGNFVSNDYGQTWTFKDLSALLSVPDFIGDVAISGSGQIQIAVSVLGGSVLVSNDYGQTWTKTGPSISVEWTDADISSDGKYQIIAADYRNNPSDDKGALYILNNTNCSATLKMDGSCGTANGKTYPYSASSYGSDTQCASGTSTNTAFPAAGGSVSWVCNGINGGNNSGTCSASRGAIPSCGTQAGAAHRLLTSTSTGLCSTGSATNFSGSTYGPWTWTCGTSNCNASLTNTAPTISAITGASSINEGSTLALSVTASDANGDTLTYTWGCTGGTLSSSTTRTPTYTAPQVSANTNYTCSVLVTDGYGGTATNSVTITVKNITANGVCGSANGQIYSASPSSNLCNSGSASTITTNSTTYTWTCSGSGGGSTAYCSADRITFKNPSDLASIGPEESCFYCEYYYDNTGTLRKGTLNVANGEAYPILEFTVDNSKYTAYKIKIVTGSDSVTTNWLPINSKTTDYTGLIVKEGITTMSALTDYTLRIPYGTGAAPKSYSWSISLRKADSAEIGWISAGTFTTPAKPYPIVKIVATTQSSYANTVKYCSTTNSLIKSADTSGCFDACWKGTGTTADLYSPNWKCSICFSSSNGQRTLCSNSGAQFSWTLPNRIGVYKDSTKGSSPNPIFQYTGSPDPKVDFPKLIINGSECAAEGELGTKAPLPIWRESK